MRLPTTDEESMLLYMKTDLLVRRGKSDLILEGVLRVERFLHEMSATIVSIIIPKPVTHPGRD